MANKLELTWVGKDEEIKLEPRILIENPKLSNIEKDKDTENMLIHGDNLLALKALESKYAGKIKCIYIDPPYNTGAAFEHYDDNVEHSIWLSLIRARLIVLRNLLANDGVICVQIDSNELGYLKVLMDEIFTRSCFVNIISCKAKIGGVSGSNMGKSLQDNVEYILIYAKNKDGFQINPVFVKQRLSSKIEEYQSEGKSWKYTSIITELGGKVLLKEDIENEINYYGYSVLKTKSITAFAKENNLTEDDVYNLYADRIFRTTNAQSSVRQTVIKQTSGFDYPMFGCEYIPIKGKNAGKKIEILYKSSPADGQRNMVMFLSDVVEKVENTYYYLEKVNTLWADIQYNNLTKEGNVQFPNGKKPEALVSRLLKLFTSVDDLVLDSFLGSGTTAAVAHKMGRKWIGIELGNHAYTHCKVRLDKVISGEDQGGISKSQNWQGGGGYRFYELAPSLIVEDKFGNPVINKEYNADMLAAAMALHEGFEYAPDQNFYWKQGKNENAYIYTTTTHLTESYLDDIAKEMKDGEYLVIACKSYDSGIERAYNNIKVKKIPQYLLGRCEFGKDNYNLNIVDVPTCEEDDDE